MLMYNVHKLIEESKKMKQNKNVEENMGYSEYIGLFISAVIFLGFVYYMVQLFTPQKISELDLEILEELKKEKLLMNEKVEE